MKKALIWDLDGTLLDSYDVIVESIYLTFQEFGINMRKDVIHHHAIAFSTKSLFQKIAEQSGFSAVELQQRYSNISTEKYRRIRLMDHALEILQESALRGVEHYVFTHRGKTTLPVLENLELTGFFREIITSQSGFARKPDPEALMYLIQKYDLQLDTTWYVGDRAIDMECAKNAGIAGILYLPANAIDVSGGAETVVVKDLLDILSVI